jgi:hypothetical protein
MEMVERFERMRVTRRDSGWNTGERGKRVAKVLALSDVLKQLLSAMNEAGLRSDQLENLGRDGLTDLVERMPITFTASELHRLREAAADKPWEPNDVNDINALSVAIVHCDAVVTERQWVDFAQRAGLDTRYETVMLSDLADLPTYLI